MKLLVGFDLMSLSYASSGSSLRGRGDSSARPGSSSGGLRASGSRSSVLGRPSSSGSLLSARSASQSSLGSARSAPRLTRQQSLVPAPAPYVAGKPSAPPSQSSSYYGNEEEKNQYIAGITVITTPSIGGMSQNAALLSLYIVVTTTSGRCVRVNVGKALGSGQLGGKGEAPLLTTFMSTQFFYHVGTIEGLCTSNNATNSVIATAGDDKRICVWDISSKELISRYISKVAIKCIAFDGTNSFIAAGMANGGVTLFAFIQLPKQRASNGGMLGHAENNPKALPSEFPCLLKELSFRKDAKECINDIKFSPDNSKLAIGSGDNYIYIYSCTYDSTSTGLNDETSIGTCMIRPISKITGHSSFITHLGT